VHELFKKKYSSIRIDSTKQADSITITTSTRSKLDADFDYLVDDEMDEVSVYLVERLAHKDTNVLSWWKVIDCMVAKKVVRMM
jgi:hypothetical protein